MRDLGPGGSCSPLFVSLFVPFSLGIKVCWRDPLAFSKRAFVLLPLTRPVHQNSAPFTQGGPDRREESRSRTELSLVVAESAVVKVVKWDVAGLRARRRSFCGIPAGMCGWRGCGQVGGADSHISVEVTDEVG